MKLLNFFLEQNHARTKKSKGRRSKMENLKSIKLIHFPLLISFVLVFIWSAFKPYQLGTWFLEVTPIVLGTIIIIYTYNKFRLTTPVYLLLCLGAIIVLIGAHYTYGKVPLFNWLQDSFHLGRNYYDRFGHFVSGFVWALTLRELLLRTPPLQKGKLLITIVLGLVLGISALYELVEWCVAIMLGGGADAFLGLQGDIWDTHWDMFLALAGAIVCLLSLSSTHNRFLVNEIGVMQRKNQAR
jgi:putative membrane protein